METGSAAPFGSQLTAEEEALARQVMAAIGGITGGACRTPEEPEGKFSWSLEEGDDSVFYSDEDQQDPADAALPTSGAKVGRLDNSVADDEPAQPMEEGDGAEGLSRIEEEAVQPTARTGETQSVQFDGGCGEPDGAGPAEQKEVEGGAQEAQAAGQDASHVPPAHGRSRRAPDVLSPLKLSSKRQLDGDGGGEQDGGFHVHAGFHPSHGRAYFTLPLMKAAPGGSQGAFDHLSSSKYSTASYRKIRRGNTRQRIEEFEFIMKNQ